MTTPDPRTTPEPSTTPDASTTPDEPDAAPVAGRRGRRRATVRIVGAGALVVLAVLLGLAAWPVPLEDLHRADARPASSYDEAQARFAQITAEEDGLDVFAPCRSALYTTGERTDVSVVLFHGLTNCPRQFQEMAEALRSEGVNVVVLRAPEHGLATPDGTRIGDVAAAGRFTAEEMRAWADTSVDIAAGLGARVRVLGLSMGGTTAAWTAQHREVDRTVLVAPAMTMHGMPGIVHWGFPNLFTRLPHVAIRVAPKLDHAYAGESPAGAAQMFRLSREVLQAARTTAPATSDIVVITNEADRQVDNGDIASMVADWRDHGASVRTEVFPASLGLPHDVVDTGQQTGRPDITYPVLLDALR